MPKLLAVDAVAIAEEIGRAVSFGKASTICWAGGVLGHVEVDDALAIVSKHDEDEEHLQARAGEAHFALGACVRCSPGIEALALATPARLGPWLARHQTGDHGTYTCLDVDLDWLGQMSVATLARNAGLVYSEYTVDGAGVGVVTELGVDTTVFEPWERQVALRRWGKRGELPGALVSAILRLSRAMEGHSSGNAHVPTAHLASVAEAPIFLRLWEASAEAV
jgi:hypothetical protein